MCLLYSDVFKYDPDFLQHEQEYKDFKSEVLGDDSEEEGESGSDSDSSSDEAGTSRCQVVPLWLISAIVEEKEGIEDKTETNLVNLRRVIYLTLQNAVRSLLDTSSKSPDDHPA